jgi:hypothetical protein
MIRFGRVCIDRKNKVIANGELSHQFCLAALCPSTNREWATFDMIQHLLLSGGISRRRLVDFLYGDREDGGPENQWDAVSVMLCHAKPILAALGMELRSEKVAGYNRYWAVCK